MIFIFTYFLCDIVNYNEIKISDSLWVLFILYCNKIAKDCFYICERPLQLLLQEVRRWTGSYESNKENFGYLSVVCIRLAYRKFMAQSADFGQVYLDAEGTSLLDETDIVDEIIHVEDTITVLESLKTLWAVERIVITQRYYGCFSFAEIAKRNGLKLNTVLSHHRRALEKLRPGLTKLLGYGKEEYYE